MASSRPTSMIIPSGVFDEINTNGSKNVLQKKDSQSTRLTNQQTLPVNNTIHAHSSSSSIDSAGAKHAILTEKNSFPQVNSIMTVSSTTTDSELESEQDERYNDDNHSSESTQLPRQLQKKKSSRSDSGSQKTDSNHTQEQLSRRVKHFQKLFKSELGENMPELIDSYVCAYQGDILLQGKMYITDRYLCFHSRIISYVTKHVYRWEQIENVTKERVAFIFPTAIGIQIKPTGKKIIYASFLQRDQAFDKILSICSRFSNETNFLQDDEENSFIQSGTLKALNNNNNNHGNSHEKIKKTKRDMDFQMPDETEHDDVLQMCLRQDKSSSYKRQVLSKTNDHKQQLQSKKSITSDKKKSSLKRSNVDQDLSSSFNENNQSSRNTCYSKDQQKQTDTNLINSSVTHHTTVRSDRSNSRNRTLSNLPDLNSSTNLMTNVDSTRINSNNDGLIKKYFRIILLSIISIIKLIIEYFVLLYNQFKTYPIKTSFILLIFIAILIIHSFYLIKLAYRIENRLQSLHHKWPSSSMTNSLPSLKEF